MRPTLGSVSGRPPHVGFCPERLPGRLRLSTTAYLRHLASIHQHPELVSDAESALRRMNFIGGADVPMSSLSKGNVQKVLLATALGLGAPLLVLDEPWSGLDSTARDALTSLLRDQAGAGRIVVLADHPEAVDDRPFQHVLELCAGHVVPRSEPAGSRGDAASLLLQSPDRAIDHAAALHPAEVAVVGVHVRVACADERVDAVLSAALSAGYSVLSVRRSGRSLPAYPLES